MGNESIVRWSGERVKPNLTVRLEALVKAGSSSEAKFADYVLKPSAR